MKSGGSTVVCIYQGSKGLTLEGCFTLPSHFAPHWNLTWSLNMTLHHCAPVKSLYNLAKFRHTCFIFLVSTSFFQGECMGRLRCLWHLSSIVHMATPSKYKWACFRSEAVIHGLFNTSRLMSFSVATKVFLGHSEYCFTEVTWPGGRSLAFLHKAKTVVMLQPVSSAISFTMRFTSCKAKILAFSSIDTPLQGLLQGTVRNGKVNMGEHSCVGGQPGGEREGRYTPLSAVSRPMN